MCLRIRWSCLKCKRYISNHVIGWEDCLRLRDLEALVALVLFILWSMLLNTFYFCCCVFSFAVLEMEFRALHLLCIVLNVNVLEQLLPSWWYYFRRLWNLSCYLTVDLIQLPPVLPPCFPFYGRIYLFGPYTKQCSSSLPLLLVLSHNNKESN